MIQRLWTLTVGYMAAYGLFNWSYPEDHPVRKKYFPKERVTLLIIGYILFFVAFTEVATWLLRKTKELLDFLIFHETIQQHEEHKEEVDRKEIDDPNSVEGYIVWIIVEIIYWYVVANEAVEAWAEVGYYYEDKHKKMFAFSLFFCLVSKYFNVTYMIA